MIFPHVVIHILLSGYSSGLETDLSLYSLHLAALFQSLLYEACGRTVNPVFGAVGLLASGNWQLCQVAVETVLKGGSLRPPSPSKFSSSFMPPRALITRLDKPVDANEVLNSRIQQVVPSHPSPELFSSELYKPRSLGMGFLDKNLQQAWGHEEEQKNVLSGMRGGLNGSTRSAQELQQHRMMQGSALHRSTWPGAVSVSFYPSKHETSFDVKDEQALGMSNRQIDVKGVGIERHESLGLCRTQILAPVARRVKPRLCTADSAMANPSSKSDLKGILAAGLGSNRSEHQPELELDLTLKVQDTKICSPAAGLQVSSPSCESAISEGSVTSHSSQVVPSQTRSTPWALEQLEKEPPPPPAGFPAVAHPPPHHHKLLPLLLWIPQCATCLKLLCANSALRWELPV